MADEKLACKLSDEDKKSVEDKINETISWLKTALLIFVSSRACVFTLNEHGEQQEGVRPAHCGPGGLHWPPLHVCACAGSLGSSGGRSRRPGSHAGRLCGP